MKKLALIFTAALILSASTMVFSDTRIDGGSDPIPQCPPGTVCQPN